MFLVAENYLFKRTLKVKFGIMEGNTSYCFIRNIIIRSFTLKLPLIKQVLLGLRTYVFIRQTEMIKQ